MQGGCRVLRLSTGDMDCMATTTPACSQYSQGSHSRLMMGLRVLRHQGRCMGAPRSTTGVGLWDHFNVGASRQMQGLTPVHYGSWPLEQPR